MPSLETTELKLKTTPTGGVDAAQSPYYRRLLSAGYKGFLQGTIGGASLYGAMGTVIGGLVAVAAFPLIGPAAVAIVPAAGGIGLIKGASTFGNIGSVAAINAESADLAEQRRYLLDRYYDLPEGPAGDREAAAIKEELEKRAGDTIAPPHIFHWKTVAIGAAIGAALVLGGLYFGGAFAAGTAGTQALMGLVEHVFGAKIALDTAAAFTATASGLALVGGSLGALAGAAIGVDRYYIRKWFDHTQDVVHSGSHKETALMERHEQVQRLREAAKADEKVKAQMEGANNATPPASLSVQEKPAQPPVASLSDTPSTKISNATLQSRLVGLQDTMKLAAL